jgi:hypothetical protein
MDTLQTLSRGAQITLATSVLLLIDMFFNWQSVDLGPVSVGQSGWHGFWGVLLGLLTIVAIAWIVLRIVQPDILRQLPVPEKTVGLALGGLILLFAVLKNLIDDYSAWPAYVGVVLAAGVAFGAWTIAQEPEPAASSPVGSPPPPAPAPPPPAPAPPPPAAEPPAPPAPEPPASAASEESPPAAPRPWEPEGEPPTESR